MIKTTLWAITGQAITITATLESDRLTIVFSTFGRYLKHMTFNGTMADNYSYAMDLRTALLALPPAYRDLTATYRSPNDRPPISHWRRDNQRIAGSIL